MPSNTRSDAKKQQKARKEELKQQCMALRVKGFNLREIAERVGVSHVHVKRILDEALAELAEQNRGKAEELRTLQLQRLEIAIKAISDAVERGDLPAIDRWIRMVEVQARYLGVPIVTEQSGKVSVEVEYLNTWRNNVAEAENLPADSAPGSAVDHSQSEAI